MGRIEICAPFFILKEGNETGPKTNVAIPRKGPQ